MSTIIQSKCLDENVSPLWNSILFSLISRNIGGLAQLINSDPKYRDPENLRVPVQNILLNSQIDSTCKNNSQLQYIYTTLAKITIKNRLGIDMQNVKFTYENIKDPTGQVLASFSSETEARSYESDVQEAPQSSLAPLSMPTSAPMSSLVPLPAPLTVPTSAPMSSLGPISMPTSTPMSSLGPSALTSAPMSSLAPISSMASVSGTVSSSVSSYPPESTIPSSSSVSTAPSSIQTGFFPQTSLSSYLESPSTKTPSSYVEMPSSSAPAQYIQGPTPSVPQSSQEIKKQSSSPTPYEKPEEIVFKVDGNEYKLKQRPRGYQRPSAGNIIFNVTTGDIIKTFEDSSESFKENFGEEPLRLSSDELSKLFEEVNTLSLSLGLGLGLGIPVLITLVLIVTALTN